jgi:hypothetical protein
MIGQVTTKKGYDGCRKAEYLYAHNPITDKTFANLGETTISNLKSNFEGVETGRGALPDPLTCLQEQQWQPPFDAAVDVKLCSSRACRHVLMAFILLSAVVA